VSKAKSTKKKVIAKEPVSRLAVVTLSKDMPGGKKTTDHPLVWLVREKMGERNKSDLARHLDVRPQSLYKWERLCRGDRNYPLPIPRAMQIAKFFRVKPGLFRPDIFGA
jgi:DNA-binding XRE family transcriptional regulator